MTEADYFKRLEEIGRDISRSRHGNKRLIEIMEEIATLNRKREIDSGTYSEQTENLIGVRSRVHNFDLCEYEIRGV